MAVSEVFESCAADSCGLPATGAGGVTGLHMLAATKVEALEFTRVNGSAVVSTGCGCGPSADSTGCCNKGHGKTSVNIENRIPADENASKRVDHQHALIAHDQLGSDENQMSRHAEENSPQGGCCGGSKTTNQPSFNRHDSADDKNDCCVSESGSRSEGLFISHKPIMAGDK